MSKSSLNIGEQKDIKGLMEKIKDMEKEMWEYKKKVRELENGEQD